MTEPGLDPEQDAVRRLLADARHDEPVPADVRARLDATLAELTAGRREVRSTDAVVDLSARRRRRRRTGLLAAAAVVVAGVGLGQVLQNTGGLGSEGDSASSTERSVASEDGAGADEAEPSPSQESGTRSYSAQADAAAAAPVRSTHLRDDLRRVRADSVATSARTSPDLSAAFGCALRVGAGDQVPITLDGDPVLAVFRPAAAGRQQVDLYECGSGEELRTVRLRAP